MNIKYLLSAAVISTTLSTAALAGSGSDKDGSKFNDAWLDGKAETTLLLNKNLNSFKIDTDVKDSVVTLSGNVNNSIDRSLAEELITGLDGVKDVENNIVIVDKKPVDEKMAAQLNSAKVASVVKSKLLLDTEVSGTTIDVDVKGGVVTLRGEVDSDAEKDLAGAIAKNTSDVEKVVNKLQIANS